MTTQMDVRTSDLVSPDSREEAVDLGWRLLRRWRELGVTAVDLTEVHQPAHFGRVPWHPMGLDPGDLGLALVYSAADDLDPDGGWDEVAHVHLSHAVEYFRHSPDLGGGLFSGTAGMAWVLAALSRGGTRYRQARADVDEQLLQRGRRLLAGFDTWDGGPATEEYDLVSGLTGVAWSLLHRHQLGPELKQLRSDIVAMFCERLVRQGAWAFYTPPERITDFERQTHPQLHGGYVNLGLAHGIAGPLAALGVAHQRGVTVAGLEDAAATLHQQVVGALRGTAYGPDVSYHEFFPLRGFGQSEADLTRTAWCYGNPGLAVALRHATELLRGRLGPSPVELLASVYRRPRSACLIDNPSLCHGWAGLLLIERLVLGSPTEQTVRRLLDLAEATSVFGFRNVPSAGTVSDSPGFLEGSGGAAVALVSLSRPGATLTAAEEMLVGRTR